MFQIENLTKDRNDLDIRNKVNLEEITRQKYERDELENNFKNQVEDLENKIKSMEREKENQLL